MSRPGSVGSRQGPSSERALPTARRAEHGTLDRLVKLGWLAAVARNDKATVLDAFRRFVQQALGFSRSGPVTEVTDDDTRVY